MPVGRPSTYTAEVTAIICARLVDGESLRSICADESMPGKSTVFQWLATHKEFADQYARAREEQADGIFEEMFEIADDGSNDFYGKGENPEEPDYFEYRGEHVQRSKLRIDTRKWALARMNPKKYGDKVTQELTGAEGGPIRFTRIEDVIVDPADDATDSGSEGV